MAYCLYGKTIAGETTQQNEYLETVTRSVFSWRDIAFFANSRAFPSFRADCTKIQSSNYIFILPHTFAGNLYVGIVSVKGKAIHLSHAIFGATFMAVFLGGFGDSGMDGFHHRFTKSRVIP